MGCANNTKYQNMKNPEKYLFSIPLLLPFCMGLCWWLQTMTCLYWTFYPKGASAAPNTRKQKNQNYIFWKMLLVFSYWSFYQQGGSIAQNVRKLKPPYNNHSEQLCFFTFCAGLIGGQWQPALSWTMPPSTSLESGQKCYILIYIIKVHQPPKELEGGAHRTPNF